MRTVDLEITGAAGNGLACLCVHCEEAGVGVTYTDEANERRCIMHCLRSAGERLGEPVALGKLIRVTAEDTGQRDLIDYDERRALPPKRKPKAKPKVPEWKQEEWGHGWAKGL